MWPGGKACLCEIKVVRPSGYFQTEVKTIAIKSGDAGDVLKSQLAMVAEDEYLKGL